MFTSLPRKNTECRSGFTLPELTIYMVLSVVVGAAFVSVVSTSITSANENLAFHTTTERSRAILWRVETALRNSMAGTAALSGEGKILSVSTTSGFDADGVVAGPALELEFRCSGGETLNGDDDNSNGLIDDGELVFRDTATNSEVIIGGNVDVAGSQFQLVGTTIRVRLSTFANAGQTGPLASRREINVQPRN